MDDTAENFCAVLEQHARLRPQRRALVYRSRSWSYAELYREAARVAQALREAGVEPQQRIGFLGRNCPEFFTTLFGSMLAGAVTVGVNWRLAPPEIEYVLNHAQVRLLFVEPEYLETLAKMKLESLRQVVLVGPEGPYPTYADWLRDAEPIDPPAAVQPGDPCFQIYTSGTTGFPKGVELSHANLLAAMRAGGSTWEVSADSVSLVAMPLFHIAGSGWALAGFMTGATNVLLRDVDPAEILQLIATERVSHLLLVPAALQLLLAAPGLAQADLSSLRIFAYGASPISEEVLVRGMRALRCGFVQVYGMTETTGAVTGLAPEDHDPAGPRAALLRSAGRPWGDVELRIVDAASGRDQKPGEIGEVWCRSRQNMCGYWRNPEATREIYPEGRDAQGLGWLRTGDAGYLRDGYLFIHDRVKDMIVSGAENVYPAEVENALMSHPGVADCAVIGVPDARWGETVKAIVVPRADAEPSDAELIAWCRERLARYKCPTSVDRATSIPRNPSGKILKTQLRKPYWAGRSRQVN